MSESKRLTRTVAAGAAILFTASLAHAEDETTSLEEVVVTAQKRAENIQEVPASVSVLGGETLQRLHVTQLADIGAYLPGFNVSGAGSPGQTTVTLRGIAGVGPGAVVGTYVDDTPLGASSNYARAIEFTLDLMPYDVERVEVLRGPQGTLYGASTMGGLLKYVLKDADPGAFKAQAGVEGLTVKGAGGSVGWGARGAVNMPIGETTAMRFSAYKQKTPGYISNAYAGGDSNENDLDQYGGRAAFLWKASDVFSVKLGGMWQRTKSDDKGFETVQIPGVPLPNGCGQLGDQIDCHALDQPFEKKVDYYSATLGLDTGWGDFTSASSYSKAHTVQRTDATFVFGVLYPLFGIPAGYNDFRLGLDLKKYTQEFRLTSKSEGALEWMIGAFYTDEKSKNTQDSFAFDFDGNTIPIFDPLFVFAALPTHYKEYAGFGNATFKIDERFDVTAGLRWAKNKQTFRQISGGAILPVANVPGSSSEDVWTYAISPRLHLNDDTMVYLRVASGYRPGGPNVFLPGVPPQVNADKLTNYEAGIKSEFADRRALVNLSYFYIDWKKIQQTQAFGGVSALSNAGDATSKGFEFESNLRPTDHWRVGINAAYTRSKLTSNPEGIDNVLGAQLPLVPKWSGAITTDYTFMLPGEHETRVGGGYRYVGDRWSQVVSADNLATVLDSYKVLDLNADMSFGPHVLRVYAKNVTDKRAVVAGGLSVDGFNVPYQIDNAILQPRTFGISMDFNF